MTRPRFRIPPFELNTCLLWPEWPTMNLSNKTRNLFLSHRTGGHYSLTGEAMTWFNENPHRKFSIRSDLTDWLQSERESSEREPLITTEVIESVQSAEEVYTSIEELIARTLNYLGSMGLGCQYMLRDDRELKDKNLDVLRERPEEMSYLFEDARILAASGCQDWDDLGVIMDHFEKFGFLKKIPSPERSGWHNYSLTLEGLRASQGSPEHAMDVGTISTPNLDRRSDTASNEVFVIYGRNDVAKVAIFDFLYSIGLSPIEWEEAVKQTGQTAPYIGSILSTAFSEARAAIVILTPDDDVTLKQGLQRQDDPPIEREVAGQPRPNVIFEAGMAISAFENRTVFVEVGEIKRFSDIAGRHTIRLADTPNCRRAIINRLEIAGCPVDQTGPEWEKAGDFAKAIESATEGLYATIAGVSDPVNQDALTILRHADNDAANGSISKLESAVGFCIRSGHSTFGGNEDEEEDERWAKALERLLARGFIEQTGLNATGFEYALTQLGKEFLSEHLDDTTA